MNNTAINSIVKKTITIDNYLSETGPDVLREEVIKGLTAEQKYISSKYFYDKKGSEIFEEITKLDDYYPTRTEKSILTNNAKSIVKDLRQTTIIEIGSGDSSKISIILNSLNNLQLKSATYIPFDVSKTAIEKSISDLSEKFPELTIKGIAADFMNQLNLIPEVKHKVICFFGSTIGNLNPQHAFEFMKKIGDIMNAGDTCLLGTDMVKNIKTLENAYNDNSNTTAAFNKNILNVVNKHLKTDFNTDLFEHHAFYNTQKSRIEMYLKTKLNMQINSPFLTQKIQLNKNESIHTENSHKFTNENILEFAQYAGLKIKTVFRDKNGWFSLIQFIK